MAKKTTQSTTSAQGTQTTQKDKAQNNIRVTGYLRETTLAIRQINGIDTITGSVSVAFNENQSLEIRCYMPKFQKDRVTPTKHYDDMLQLVQGADGCVSIAQLFKDKRVSSFLEAVAGVAAHGDAPAVPAATKVVASGELDEHLYIGRDGERHSTTRVRCRFLAKVKHDDTFFPSNQFRVIGYVMSNITDPTSNRVSVKLAVPAYNGVVSQFTFKTPDANDQTEISAGIKVGQYADLAAQAVSQQYVPGTTVSVLGYISDTKVTKVQEPIEGADSFFGVGAQTWTKSTFIHENVVYGGDPEHKPLMEGEPHAYTKQEITQGIALKEADFQKQLEKAKQPKPVIPVFAGAPSVSSTVGFGGFGFTGAPKAAPTPVVVPDVPPTAVDDVDDAEDEAPVASAAPVAPASPATSTDAALASKVGSFDF